MIQVHYFDNKCPKSRWYMYSFPCKCMSSVQTMLRWSPTISVQITQLSKHVLRKVLVYKSTCTEPVNLPHWGLHRRKCRTCRCSCCPLSRPAWSDRSDPRRRPGLLFYAEHDAPWLAANNTQRPVHTINTCNTLNPEEELMHSDHFDLSTQIIQQVWGPVDENLSRESLTINRKRKRKNGLR